jgi:hypothetical protein
MDVNGTLTVSDSTVTGGRNAIAVRAGTATITDTTVEIDATNHFANTTPGDWGTTNGLPAAALLVGNYSSGEIGTAYTTAADVTVDGCTITGIEGNNAIPAVYVGGTADAPGSVTINNAGTYVVGAITTEEKAAEGAANITINGGSFRRLSYETLKKYIPTDAAYKEHTYTESSVTDSVTSTWVGYVAQVGNKKYWGLQSAVNDVTSTNDTITLLDDFNLYRAKRLGYS